MKRGMTYDEYIKSDWYIKHKEKLASRKYGPKAPLTGRSEKQFQKMKSVRRDTWLMLNK